MGREIPEPITVEPVAAGDACTICWGSDKPFGDGDTPETVTVNFSGINKADDWTLIDGEPVAGEFVLNQNPSFPCRYDLLSGSLLFDLRFESGTTTMFVEESGLVTKFDGSESEACQTLIFNDMSSGFEGGTCLVIIPEVD